MLMKKALFAVLFCFMGISAVHAEDCAEGYVSDGKGGCRLPACYDDADCHIDQVCENGGSAKARCVLKKDGSDCYCSVEQTKEGAKRCYVHKGVCTPAFCEKYNDCPEGQTCYDAGKEGKRCKICDMDAKMPDCHCPPGTLGNGAGGCIKPQCTTTPNDTCPVGQHCTFPDKSAAACEDCPAGTQCTCPLEKIADGKGWCVTGCAYTSQVSCEKGVKACQRCTRDNKCWVCNDCADGYYLDAARNLCRPCSDKCAICFSAMNCVECQEDHKLNAEGVCVPKVCTDYNKTFRTDCDIGQKRFETGITAGDGKECFTCVTLTCEDLKMHRDDDGPWAKRCLLDGGSVETDGKCFFCKAGVCPEGFSTETTRCPRDKKLAVDGKANGKPCGRCVPKLCAEIDEELKSSCDLSIETPVSTEFTGEDGACFLCTPKTCSERNKEYKTSCPDEKIAEKTGVTGKDGPCFICREKTCRELDPTFVTERRKCRKGRKISTGFSAFDGKCFYCDTDE